MTRTSQMTDNQFAEFLLTHSVSGGDSTTDSTGATFSSTSVGDIFASIVTAAQQGYNTYTAGQISQTQAATTNSMMFYGLLAVVGIGILLVLKKA